MLELKLSTLRSHALQIKHACTRDGSGGGGGLTPIGLAISRAEGLSAQIFSRAEREFQPPNPPPPPPPNPPLMHSYFVLVICDRRHTAHTTNRIIAHSEMVRMKVTVTAIAIPLVSDDST